MPIYGFKKELAKDFEDVVKEVEQKLKEQGFGIITRIDLKEKFKEKLGIDFKRYLILGACNPEFAHQGLELEEDLGLLLPCNVVVCEQGGGKTVVSVSKPSFLVQGISNPELEKFAQKVEEKLKQAFDKIG